MFDHVKAFHRPQTIREALRLLHVEGGHARAVAGGTDLVVERDRSVRSLIDLSRLGLDHIRKDGHGVVIGAMACMADIERSPLVQEIGGGILAQAAAACGSPQNRNMATLGGNLATASPAAESAPALLVLDAEIVLQGLRGKREMPLDEFFAGAHKPRLGGALIVEIRIPATHGDSGWSFQKLSRTKADLAIVNAAAGLELDKSGSCLKARIALGAVASTPVRARAAEKLLEGALLSRSMVEKAAAAVVRDIKPISDHRASAEYRIEMAQVLVKRALMECAASCGRQL